ncbi:MAG: N-6 DNA methylase [Myxococcales bacterium]|nr:SAM-dependent methyltransferase [Myxococcota bacterium]MDW8281772.1 N-6 DNA methylase [Myxococcales bacterium]
MPASSVDVEAAALLGAWLDRGAPEGEPPSLPANLPPERLGVLYERYLLTARRERGAYYTPPRLVRPLLDATLGGQDLSGALVLDPACGAGAFLVAMAERLRQGGGGGWLDRLVGRDSDPYAVKVARLALSQLAGVPLEAVQGVRVGDALRDPSLRSGSFDVILGNPPFLGEEDHGSLLAGLRGSRVGPYLQPRTDLAYLFAHLCLDLLAPGGRLGLVMPEGLLWADGASRLRRRLLDETRIEVITSVELPAAVLFPAAPGQRLCLLAVRKGPAPTHRPRVARLGECGLDVLHRAPPQGVLLAQGGMLRLGPPQAEALCERMQRNGVPLGRCFTVDTGIQAGPSRLSHKAAERLGDALAARPGEGVFVLNNEEIASLHLSAAERQFLRPFYFASELPPLGPLPPASHWLLYLTPQTCPDLTPFPNLERHLDRFAPLLQRRRETRRGTRAPFHLHWPRREELFTGPKLLSVRQTLQPRVTYAPDPAFCDLAVNVIRSRQGVCSFSLLALAALLNSTMVHHYLYHRGKRKGPLLQIDGGPLSSLPLPPWDAALDRRLTEIAQRLLAAPSSARAALCEELDHVVAEAYGAAGPASLARMVWQQRLD